MLISLKSSLNRFFDLTERLTAGFLFQVLFLLNLICYKIFAESLSRKVLYLKGPNENLTD